MTERLLDARVEVEVRPGAVVAVDLPRLRHAPGRSLFFGNYAGSDKRPRLQPFARLVGEATVKRPRDLGAWIPLDALAAVASPSGPLTPILDPLDNRGAIAKRDDVSDLNRVVTPHGELVCLVADDDRVDEARHGGIIA
jgi:hypothetical protein